MRALQGRAYLAAAVAAALLLPGCAWDPRVFSSVPGESFLPDNEVALPVMWWEDLAFVQATVDGVGPYTFLLDTGAEVAVVDPRVAEAHAGGTARFEDALPAVGPGPGGVLVEEALRISDLRMGGTRFSGIDAIVVDLTPFSELAGFPVDGILGFRVFAGHLLTLDYPARQVRIARGTVGPPDGEYVLPLRGSGVAEVDLESVWGPIRVVLDSGAEGCVSLDAWPGGATFLYGPVPGRRSLTVGGLTDRKPTARLREDLLLGRHRVRSPVVSLAGGPPRAGTALLRNFSLTFDQVGRAVRIERPEEEADVEIPPVAGVGASIDPRGGGWKVLDVLPGAPAEKAGLRIGDHVVRVNGIPAVTGRQGAVREALRTRGAIVRVVVERDGRERTFEVPVVDLVP